MIIVLGLLQLVTPAPAPADTVATDSTKPPGLCWRARPLPRCQWLLVTELGMSGSSQDAYGPRLDLSYGLMRNVGPRAAIGAAFLFSGDESHERIGFIMRYRRWLHPSVGLEFGFGPVRFAESQGSGDGSAAHQSGIQLETAVHFGGLVAATATFEHLAANRPAEFGTTLPEQNRLYFGMKTGGYAAPLALLGLGILVGATWN